METKVDEDYSRRVLDANRRKNKLDKLREKVLERQKNLKDINDVLLSHDSMTEEIQFSSEEEKSNEDCEISEEDGFLGNGRKRRYSIILITYL